MDPEAGPRERLEQQFDCPGYADAGACLDAAQPDAAIVCGKHVAIPGYLQACVERRIPYLLDKPFADCAARLRPVAEATMAHGIPHALTLPNRGSLLVEKVAQMVADGSLGELVLYSSRLNNGPPTRYDPTPSYWLNVPAQSGGGSWIVEASHGIDTFLQFAGTGPATVIGAVISNLLHRREVEDTAVGMIRTASGVTGIIESGFNYPSGTRSGDHFFRFVGSKASVFQRYGDHGEPLIEVHTSDGVAITPTSATASACARRGVGAAGNRRRSHRHPRRDAGGARAGGAGRDVRICPRHPRRRRPVPAGAHHRSAERQFAWGMRRLRAVPLVSSRRLMADARIRSGRWAVCSVAAHRSMLRSMAEPMIRAVPPPLAGRRGPERLEFPGCRPVRISRADIAAYERRIEYWSRDTEVAMVSNRSATTMSARRIASRSWPD